MSTSLRK